jgi:TatD DNase family protein
MYIDSHCHLDFPELRQRLPEIFQRMQENRVTHALCVAVDLPGFPQVLELAQQHDFLYASAGVHPDYEDTQDPGVDELLRMADHPKVVAIGETGLDYYRLQGDLEWQRQRFRNHIRASRSSRKPLIIHTRNASADTIALMREEGAAPQDGGVGGVMHCFTESLAVAQAAMELGFYISFSGIVTFKSARELQAVAQAVPLSRMLIETDAPYLAPVPFRGKTNEPGFVRYTAEFLANLKGVPVEELAHQTSENFRQLFGVPQ